MMQTSSTSARFTRTGRALHLHIATAVDLRSALDLNEAHWVAISAPIHTLHLDALFLKLVDSDHDGRIKLVLLPPLFYAAIPRYALRVLDSRSASERLFQNVFVNPTSYRYFTENGAWPDKTIFVLELRRAATEASINQLARHPS